MTGGDRLLSVILVAVAVFGAGVAVGAYGLGGAGRPPCWQVEQDLQAAQDALAETFGSGPDGEAALAQVQEKTEERPDCFSPATRDLFRRQREQGGTQRPGPTEPAASEAASDS